MEQIYLKIDIYDLAAKYLNARSHKKLDIIFNLLNLKNRGFVSNTPLIKLAGLLEIDIRLLKDKISAVKNDDDLFPITARYKMMAKYNMISQEDLSVLREHANYKFDHLYKTMDIEKQERIIYKQILDIQLN